MASRLEQQIQSSPFEVEDSEGRQSRSSRRDPAARPEKILDSQFNHSKIVRLIEEDLQALMLNYNLSKIIQMNLDEKLQLRNQILQVLRLKQKINSYHVKKSYQIDMRSMMLKSMFSESDLHQNKHER